MFSVLYMLLLFSPYSNFSVAHESECRLSIEGFVAAMRGGDWECARSAARDAVDDIAAGDMAAAFDVEHRRIVSELASIKGIVEGRKGGGADTVYLSPAFAWAQSPEDVFLSVKFSHKLDAPATLNVAHNMTVEGSRLLLLGSNGVKHFRLDLDLLREVVPENCSWSSSSNGRITVTLQKSVVSKWSRLLRDNKKKPSNMHFWHDKQESYLSALEALPDGDKKKGTGGEGDIVKGTEGDKKKGADGEGEIVKGTEGDKKKEAEDEGRVPPEAELRRRERANRLKRSLAELEEERSLRLAEAGRRAVADRDAVDRDIAARRKELMDKNEAEEERSRAGDEF